MKALSILLFIVLPLSTAANGEAVEEEYLEPNVQRHVGVLPESVCKQLIDLGEEGIYICIYCTSLSYRCIL